MKKILLMISAVLMCAASAWALSDAELQGKWASNSINQTDEMSGASVQASVELTFKGDKVDMKTISNTNMDMQGIKIYVYNEVTGSGAYTVAGDSITITVDPATIDFKCTEDDIRITGVEDAAQQAQMKTQMVAGMQQTAPMMKEQMAKPDVFNNVMILGKKMTCINNGIMLTFKKK